MQLFSTFNAFFNHLKAFSGFLMTKPSNRKKCCFDKYLFQSKSLNVVRNVNQRMVFKTFEFLFCDTFI